MVVGSFDTVVDIRYALEISVKEKVDLWLTAEDFTYYVGNVTDQKYILVPKGTLTDGASVPRLFWSFFPPWGSYGQAAILHDQLCQRRVLTKHGDKEDLSLTLKEIDQLFYDAMKVLQTPVWKRSLMFAAVKLYHVFNK